MKKILKETYDDIKRSAPTNPIILTTSLLLPAGTLLLAGITIWNYYNSKKS